MTITLDDVTKVANLARISIDEKEALHYLENLQEILKLANQMEKVNTESVQAVAHCFDITQRLRPDEITEPDQHERLQQLTQEVQAGLYIVPPVIE
jgi:aspartyl-tRNA(Asn)/glutamyl-tRNA(Gln) amidotransferase subunit C